MLLLASSLGCYTGVTFGETDLGGSSAATVGQSTGLAGTDDAPPPSTGQFPSPTTESEDGSDDPASSDGSEESSTGGEVEPDDPVPPSLVVDGDRFRFIGNSFTGNFGGLNNYFAAALAAGANIQIETDPSNGDWYYGQPLSAMYGAIDEIAADGNYDTCVFTNGDVDDMRAFAAALTPLCSNVVLYVTWQGANPATQSNYASAIGSLLDDARTLEAEFPDLRVVPAALVFYDLSVDPPVSPPRSDYLYLRDNIHQNGLGTIVNSFAFFAALYGASPEGVAYDYQAAGGIPFVQGMTVGLGAEEAPFGGGAADAMELDPELRDTIQRRVWALTSAWYGQSTEFD